MQLRTLLCAFLLSGSEPGPNAPPVKGWLLASPRTPSLQSVLDHWPRRFPGDLRVVDPAAESEFDPPPRSFVLVEGTGAGTAVETDALRDWVAAGGKLILWGTDWSPAAPGWLELPPLAERPGWNAQPEDRGAVEFAEREEHELLRFLGGTRHHALALERSIRRPAPGWQVLAKDTGGGMSWGVREVGRGAVTFLQFPRELMAQHEIVLRLLASLQVWWGAEEPAPSPADEPSLIDAESLPGGWPTHRDLLDAVGGAHASDVPDRSLPPLVWKVPPSERARLLWLRAYQGHAVPQAVTCRIDGRDTPATHTTREGGTFSWWLVGSVPAGTHEVQVVDRPDQFEMPDCLLLAEEGFHPVLAADRLRALADWREAEVGFLEDALPFVHDGDPHTWPDPRHVTAWQERTRAVLERSLGWEEGLESPPLEAEILGTTGFDDHRIQRVRYTSMPGFRVPACLYLPEGPPPPWPAVLIPVGHWSVGKADASLQKQAIDLARIGIAALIPETLGQGERGAANNSHQASFGLALSGLSSRGVMLHELRRGLDYLQSRDDVRADALGVSGSSAGGLDSWLLAATDRRIAASAPVAFVTGHRELLLRRARQCPCIYFPELAAHLDPAEILALAAPTPLLLVSAQRDPLFPIAGSRRVLTEARELYTIAGAAGHLLDFESNDVHAHNQEMRERITGFFGRFLRAEDIAEAVPESPVKVLAADDPALRVFREEGDPSTRTLVDLAAENAIRCQDIRAGFGPKGPALDQRIRRALHVPLVHETARRMDERVTETNVGPCRVQTWRVVSGKSLPVLRFAVRDGAPPTARVVVVAAGPKESLLWSGDVARLLRARAEVWVVEVSGSGERRPPDFLAARNGLLVGQPVLGKRLQELESLLHGLPGEAPLILLGHDLVSSVLVELTAVLHAPVRGVIVRERLDRFASLIGRFNEPEELYPGRVLHHFDLPEVHELLDQRLALFARLDELRDEDLRSVR